MSLATQASWVEDDDLEPYSPLAVAAVWAGAFALGIAFWFGVAFAIYEVVR